MTPPEHAPPDRTDPPLQADEGPSRRRTHMIEEYTRHNGHADLLREAIDGRAGE